MKYKVLFVERKPCDTVSIEKVFRQIAVSLSENFEPSFQQVPFGPRLGGTIKNLLFFRKRRADLYHITGHIHYIALLFSPANTILSIHDCRFLYRPGGLRRFILKKLYLDLPVRRLRYISAISEQTRQEILTHTNCDEKKVRVLELPLMDHIHYSEVKPFNRDNPRILQVGIMANKNIPNLVAALEGIQCTLRIIGRLDHSLISALEAHKIDYENSFELNDEEMRDEYYFADIVSFCSTYEGFGLPIIEAQAMRKPVITSDLSPMKETAGGGAYLADPFNPGSIKQGIQKIIGDADFRKMIVERGLVNVERFRPERIADQYESLYKEVLENIQH